MWDDFCIISAVRRKILSLTLFEVQRFITVYHLLSSFIAIYRLSITFYGLLSPFVTFYRLFRHKLVAIRKGGTLLFVADTCFNIFTCRTDRSPDRSDRSSTIGHPDTT